MSQHTPGAVRLADIILNQEFTILTAYGRKTAEGLADLIDRETAAPALVAACEDAQDALHRLANGQGTVAGLTIGDTKRIIRMVRDNLQAALALAKGE